MEKMHLRRNGKIISGILVPFASRLDDAYGTYWDENTDFGLDMFSPHPLLYWHGLKGGPARDGTIIRMWMESDGLHFEAEVEEDSLTAQLVDSRRAAASSGTLPHLIEANPATGYIRRWPVVEGSVLDVAHAGAKRGLTKVDYVRAVMPALEYEGSYYLRSMWIGGYEMDPVVVETPSVENSLANAVNSLVGLVERIELRINALESAPIRALPVREEHPLEVTPPPAPSIRVGSEFDGASALALLLYDQANQAYKARDRAHPYVRSERLFQAIMHKVLEEANKESSVVEKLEHLPGLNEPLYYPIRAVDRNAEKRLRSYFPNLRANEAMASTGANIGDELVPTLLNSMVYHYYRLESKVLGLFESFEMPSQPFDYPKITGGPTYRLKAEAVNQTAWNVGAAVTPTSKIATAKVTFSAGQIGALTLIPRELLEDAGVGAAQAFMDEYVRQGAAAIDRCLISGDETATTSNSGHAGTDPTGTAYDWLLAMTGLREIALTATDATDLTTLADPDFITVAQLMGAGGKFGIDTTKLAVICDIGTYYDLIALADYKKLNEVGDMATLLSGMQGFWRGAPVIVPDPDVYEFTNATGLIEDSHDTTLSSLLLAYRPGIKVGWRRGMEHELDKVPGVDGWFLNSSARLDLQAMETGVVGYGYNVGGS